MCRVIGAEGETIMAALVCAIGVEMGCVSMRVRLRVCRLSGAQA